MKGASDKRLHSIGFRSHQVSPSADPHRQKDEWLSRAGVGGTRGKGGESYHMPGFSRGKDKALI